jgi:putative DNA primase/helicase
MAGGRATKTIKKYESLNSAGHVEITGEGRDEWGQRFFKFVVRGSSANIPPFSAKEITENPKALFSELTNAGASLFTQSSRSDFLRELDKLQSQPAKFKVVTRLGWNSGAFVLPGKIVGGAKTPLEPSFRHLDQHVLGKYRTKGTLDQWQRKIGKLCSGNSRLMFCASLGLTGPILPLVGGPRSGGFQLFGPAETGKTAAAMVTGSLWGCHRSRERRENGFSESWHTTAGKIEITALAHNETVLILDETKRAGRTKERGEAVLDISFGLAEGVEKERLTNVGSIRGWLFYFLSTSNYSFDELARRAGLEIDDAERGRLVDIPNPIAGYGIYEDLHGFENGQKFTDALKVRCRKFYGTPGEEFVRRLVEDRARDASALKQVLKEERKAYLQALQATTEAQNLRPLNRASGRFATTFAAGSLGIKYGILPWTREDLLQAILSCQLDGLRYSQVKNEPVDTSVSGLRRKLVRYLADNRDQFRNLDENMPASGTHAFGSVPGYFATFKGKKWFYLTADKLQAIIRTGDNTDQLKTELAADGLLDRASTGKYLVQRRIFSGAKGNKGHRWVHAFRAKILQDRDQN